MKSTTYGGEEPGLIECGRMYSIRRAGMQENFLGHLEISWVGGGMMSDKLVDH
jgi:hypothetical protein